MENLYHFLGHVPLQYAFDTGIRQLVHTHKPIIMTFLMLKSESVSFLEKSSSGFYFQVEKKNQTSVLNCQILLVQAPVQTFSWGPLHWPSIDIMYPVPFHR